MFRCLNVVVMSNLNLLLMPKNSVLGKPDYRAKLPRHGHNVSQQIHFTSSCGHILPVYFDYLTYGDKVRISADLFTRTEPLLKPVLGDVDEYVDFFFVPMQKILSCFNELERGVNDFASQLVAEINILNNDSFKILPTFSKDFMAQGGAIGAWENARACGQESEFVPVGFYRLLDMLGNNPNLALYSNSEFRTELGRNSFLENYMPQFCLAPLAAYQAIYYDYYRLSQWQWNDTGAYNFDDTLKTNLVFGNLSSVSRFIDLCSIRYRAYNRDYFKAIEPSPLISSTGLIANQYSLADDALELTGQDLRSWLTSSIFEGVDSANQPQGISDNTTFTFGDLNLSAFRSSVAYNKLLKITQRAGRHFDDQVLAHFGFKVPKGISNEVYFLGSHHQQIHFGEVISTASTEDASLGSLAGKGYSKGISKPIQFTAPCIGVLMACYSCVPRISYTDGVNKLWSYVTRFDFPQPELDKLGMQPLFGYEVNGMNANAGTRLGWQWRYMPLKTKYDRATRAFRAVRSYTNVNDGIYRDWSFVLPASRSMASGVDEFLCMPTDLNSVFLKQFLTPTLVDVVDDLLDNVMPYNTIYAGDNFIHDLSVKCFKTSWMSVFGDEPIDC